MDEKYEAQAVFVAVVSLESEKPRSKIPSLPAEQYLSGFKLIVVLISLVLATFLVAIDISIIAVAIPKISTEFKSLNDIGWYGSGYLLTVTALQPLAGKLYKLFSTRLVLLTSIFIFEVGSAISGAAPSSSVLIFGRAVAGVGAAGIIQGAFGTVTFIAPLEKRPAYIGVLGATFGISSCLSPTLGGVLTDRAGWRWNFWINLPIGAVAFVLLSIFLNVKRTDMRIKGRGFWQNFLSLDPVGVILLLGSICSLLLVLQWGGADSPWHSPKIIGLWVTFGVSLLAFGAIQYWMGDDATVPPRILMNRTVLWGATSLFLQSISTHIKTYYMPVYFQAVQGSSAIQSGVRFLSFAVPQTVGAALAGGLATTTGHYLPVMILGEVICTIGTGLLISLQVSSSTILWATFMVLAGLGDGICCNMPYTAMQVIFEDENDVFIGNAIATFGTLAGGGVGVGIGSNLLRSILFSEIPKHNLPIAVDHIVDAGPLGLQGLTSSPTVTHALREAYAEAVSGTNIAATVAIAISVVTAFGMQFKNVKKVAAMRKAQSQQIT